MHYNSLLVLCSGCVRTASHMHAADPYITLDSSLYNSQSYTFQTPYSIYKVMFHSIYPYDKNLSQAVGINLGRPY